MKRNAGFGVGQQGFHPRARGALPVDSKHRRMKFWGGGGPESFDHYFVPSFSIRRHVHRSDEARWAGAQKQLSHIMGRHYTIMPPESMAIKSIEQKALIEKIRESNSRPTGDEMRDVVYNVRDGLTEALATSSDRLEVGLGRLAVFGRNHNKIGFTIDGWRGWRARYALTDEYGEMTTLGALLVENQIALGGITTALADTAVAVNDIASNPHLTIASTNESIRDHELRKVQDAVGELQLNHVWVGDPVISFRAAPDKDTETLYVRHAWDTLALMA